MTWVRLDDAFTEHPKVVAAGPLAAWLHVCALAYCNRNLTDGHVPASVARRLADIDNPAEAIAALVANGLWDKDEGGYRIHGYLEYQPAKEQVLHERELAKERQARAREKRVTPDVTRESRRDMTVSHAVTSPELRPKFARSSAAPTRPDPNPTLNPKKELYEANASSSTSVDVQAVYDHWRKARNKTDRRYDKLSDGRRSKIRARLREFSADELIRAIDAVALDPWEDRPRHDDVTVLFRSKETVDRFLEMANAPPARVNGYVSDEEKRAGMLLHKQRLIERGL
jgi:hypothetical protein